MTNSIRVAALSDLGCGRANNEDSFGYDTEHQIYVVCDGMGGLSSGEVASQLAVAAFLEVVAASHPATPAQTILHHAITAANDSVHLAGRQPQHKGMGTTLVAAAVEDSKLFVGNVGDSRAYMIQNQRCMQLTVDHSYLNELIRTGIVAPENAATVDLQGMQSIITRAIGVASTIEPDFFVIDLRPGDVILLASDGLTRYVSQDEIGKLPYDDLDASAQQLIELAKSRGGADNITALLFRIVPDPSLAQERSAEG